MSNTMAMTNDPLAELPPRRETFLARYPRKWKLALTALGLLAIASPSIKPFIPFLNTDEIASTTEKKSTSLAHDKTRNKISPLPKAEGAKLAPKIPTTNNEIEAAALNDKDDKATRLATAPDAGLIEGDGRDGYLPTRGPDGRVPWQVYARPFDTADTRPRIAIVIEGLGMSRLATDSAIQRLPAQITLSFDIQSPFVDSWLTRARDDGHETLLSLSLEPTDYPQSDPGPNTLLTSRSDDDNKNRLLWALRRGAGYVGMAASGDTRFATDPGKIDIVVEEAQKRGLLLFDPHPTKQLNIGETARDAGVPHAASTYRIDSIETPEAIDAALTYLEQTARLKGRAIGVAAPLPLALDRIEKWAHQISAHNIALAPLSAMVE